MHVNGCGDFDSYITRSFNFARYDMFAVLILTMFKFHFYMERNIKTIRVTNHDDRGQP
jgi:hypothetical protein